MAALILLRAPTGYGKTVLLNQWIQASTASAAIIPVGRPLDHALRSVASTENDPSNPVTLIESILTGDTAPPTQSMPDILAHLFGSDRPIVVIADSLERYQPGAVRWLLSHLQDETRPTSPAVHLVISGRMRASSLVGAAAARGLVTNISHADLAFTLPEITQLLGSSHLSASASLDGVLLDTRGWPAGVRMHQAFSRASSEAGLIPVIDSYVQSEILERLEQPIRDLAMSLTLAPYFTLDMVYATCPQEIDCDSAVDQLGQVLPLIWHRMPSGHQAYRLVPIVDESLRRIARSSPGQLSLAPMVRKATAWFAAHHHVPDAIQLGITSGEWPIVLDEIFDACRKLAERDEHNQLLDILESVPVEHLLAVPELSFWRLMALISTGRHREATRDWEAMIEQRPVLPGPIGHGRQLLLRALGHQAEDDPDAALEAATGALQMLPPTAHHERFRALSVIRDCSGCANASVLRKLDADLRFERSLLPLDQRWWWTHCLPAQVDQRALSGNLDGAFQICQHHVQTMPQGPETGRLSLLIRLAEIDLERGDAETALGHLAGFGDGLIPWKEGLSIDLMRSRVFHDLGQQVVARNLVYSCIRSADAMGDAASSLRARATLAQMWLDQGEIELAQAWATDESPSLTHWPETFGEPFPALVQAELLIATQRAGEALQVLERVSTEGKARGQTALLVRCYALMAQAHWTMGDHVRLTDAVAEAIRLGSRHRFRRSYMVGSMDIRTLSSRPAPVSFASAAPSLDTPELLLTDREMEILQLVASGLRNQDISERLYISPFTVKNHLANIFAKLDVRNRADAIRVAQSMGWL